MCVPACTCANLCVRAHPVRKALRIIITAALLACENCQYSQRLTGCEGSQRLTGCEVSQSLTGCEGSQRLTGCEGTQSLTGCEGSQRLTGCEGSQRLTGFEDSQILTGCEGFQRLTGCAEAMSCLTPIFCLFIMTKSVNRASILVQPRVSAY